MTREEAIDIIRKNIPHLGIGAAEMTEALNELIPELRESEDGRIRMALIELLKEVEEDETYTGRQHIPNMISYLERLKEQKDFQVKVEQRMEYLWDKLPDAHRVEEGNCTPDEWKTLGAYMELEMNFDKGSEEKQKEQKPNSTEDMPYVADEHFFEREPADSFKYRLAEYMTKNCKKGEGPYGYSYNISSESILEMAKEELIKRGELKNPKQEWSEEDKRALNDAIVALSEWGYGSAPHILPSLALESARRLKSLL